MSLTKFTGTTSTNERGNKVTWKDNSVPWDRYLYDAQLDKNWDQFDTWQDAPYFGVWVNAKKYKILTYAEGDVTLVECPNVRCFLAEIADMTTFYNKTN